VVEGVAETVSSLLKLVSGRISDRVGRRKPLVVAGYAIAAATRPFLALAGSPWTVLMLRATDRVGKGLRTSPRDAMLAENAPPEHRGAVFGFHRAMDHAGSILGAGIAFALTMWWTTDLRRIFLWSALPAAFAVATVAFFAQESAPRVRAPAATGSPAATRSPPAFASLPPRLRWALVAIGLLGLGQLSDAFLLLKAGEAGVREMMLPLLWMAFHLVKVVASLGSGFVADKLGKQQVMAIGWVARAAIYGAFALAGSIEATCAVFVVYGVYHGLTEGTEKALVADLAAVGTGTSFGWYNLVSGLVALPAGLLLGGLWTAFGAPVAFGTGAILALFALFPLARSARG
jgi:MFS-type transporter involved in bile tolerance (Atg22 family)